MMPLDELVDSSDNMYKTTCAIIRRANQLTITGDKVIDDFKGKIVTAAISEIMDGKVKYRFEYDEE